MNERTHLTLIEGHLSRARQQRLREQSTAFLHELHLPKPSDHSLFVESFQDITPKLLERQFTHIPPEAWSPVMHERPDIPLAELFMNELPHAFGQLGVSLAQSLRGNSMYAQQIPVLRIRGVVIADRFSEYTPLFRTREAGFRRQPTSEPFAPQRLTVPRVFGTLPTQTHLTIPYARVPTVTELGMQLKREQPSLRGTDAIAQARLLLEQPPRFMMDITYPEHDYFRQTWNKEVLTEHTRFSQEIIDGLRWGEEVLQRLINDLLRTPGQTSSERQFGFCGVQESAFEPNEIIKRAVPHIQKMQTPLHR